jgi:prepilin-type N-terminal cleavage/methylation domain-containing protein/prepilin-type processing-associated H-X9-DG protein
MRRRGFTLVELLVILAIVAVALALCAPAVSRLTQDARSVQCRNNLKQIGLALHNYHDVYNTFPPGWVSRDAAPRTGPRTGWQAGLLPFLDQAPLYNQINFSRPPMDQSGNAPKLFQTELAVLRCPADPTPGTNPLRGNYGTSNYSGNYGHLPAPRLAPLGLADFWPGAAAAPMRSQGIFARNSRIGIRDITDGTSNTLMAGERSFSSGSAVWVGVTDNTHEDDALSETSHRAQLNQGWFSFSSPHSGGVQFVFCDGSVRFISDRIDSKPAPDFGVLQLLGGRSDGRPLPSIEDARP